MYIFGSDHRPIVITYEDSIPKVNNKLRYKWRTSKADWQAYAKEIDDRLPRNYEQKNLIKIEKNYQKSDSEDSKQKVGKKQATHRTNAR